MQKIIVATDYSEAAGNAIDYAVALTNEFGSLLTLVAAVDEPYSAGAGALVNIKEHIRDEAIETLTKVKNEVTPRLTNGAQVDLHTVDGAPGSTIPRVAKAKGYDLIVMGTKGSTAAREMFTGSVANATIKNAEIPVIAVPENIPYRPLRRILLAVDERPLAGAHVLAPLRILAEKTGAEIIIYHGDADGDGKGYDPALPDYLSGLNFRFEIRSGNDASISEGIQRAVKLYDADLLGMIYHDRGFFGRLFNQSTVSKIAFDSPTALLVLRDA